MKKDTKDRLIAWGASVGIHAVVLLLIASTGIFAMANHHPSETEMTEVFYDASGYGSGGSSGASETAAEAAAVETLPAADGIAINEPEALQTETTSEEPPQKPSSTQKSGTGEKSGNGGVGNGDGSGSGNSGKGGGGLGASAGRPDPNSQVPAVMPQLLSRVSPAYPENLRMSNTSGSVGVSFIVGASGAVESVSVIESSGYEEFDSAAVEAVYQYSFQPAYNEAGRAVACRFSTVIHFALR